VPVRLCRSPCSRGLLGTGGADVEIVRELRHRLGHLVEEGRAAVVDVGVVGAAVLDSDLQAGVEGDEVAEEQAIAVFA